MSEKILSCEECGHMIAEPQLLEHLETHVGPSYMRAAFLRCSCRFKTTVNELEAMMRHCATTGHSSDSVQMELNLLAAKEEYRLHEILRLGTQIHSNKLREDDQYFADLAANSSAKRNKRNYSLSLLDSVIEEPELSNTSSRRETHWMPDQTEHRSSAAGKRGLGQKSNPRRKTAPGSVLSLPINAEGRSERETIQPLQSKKVDRESLDVRARSETATSKSARISQIDEDTSSIKTEITPVTPANEEYEEDSDPISAENQGESSTSAAIFSAVREKKPRKDRTVKELVNVVDCALCSRTLRIHNVRHAVDHLLTHNPEFKPFRCNQCSFATARKSHVLKHIELESSQDPGAKCTYDIVQQPNVNEVVRNLIINMFPGVDWDSKLPQGKAIPGLTVSNTDLSDWQL